MIGECMCIVSWVQECWYSRLCEMVCARWCRYGACGDLAAVREEERASSRGEGCDRPLVAEEAIVD